MSDILYNRLPAFAMHIFHSYAFNIFDLVLFVCLHLYTFFLITYILNTLYHLDLCFCLFYLLFIYLFFSFTNRMKIVTENML